MSNRASAMIDRVLAAETDDFTKLVLAAGLSPTRDFRNALLRDVDFRGCDLDTFDFSGAAFESCRFDGAFVAGANFEGASFLSCSLAEAADSAYRFPPAAAGTGLIMVPADGDQSLAPNSILAGIGRGGADSSSMSGILPPADVPLWRIRCLCAVVNFGKVRREIGSHRASRLMLEAIQLAEDVILTPHRTAASESRIEIVFENESPEAAASDMSRVHSRLAGWASIDGVKLRLDVRIGIGVAPFGEEDEERLIYAAESALERTREDLPIVMIDISRDDAALDRLTLLADLPRAITEDELFIQYQPKLHLRQHKVVGLEVLLRWSHPERGLILPSEFIPAAEEGGEIAAVTLWTLQRVLQHQKLLRDDGHDLPAFLNLSDTLLSDHGFVEKVCAILDTVDAKIGFEISETAVIRDPENAIRHLKFFADRGILIAIDNYGVGLSSLAYLKQLPASELKVDKIFVTQLSNSNRDPLIVRSTIDLAHALEMEVTAEGVESISTLKLLAVMGCDMAQGYLISRPLDLEQMRAFLAEEHRHGLVGEPNSLVGSNDFRKIV